jgi:hypothetical protein
LKEEKKVNCSMNLFPEKLNDFKEEQMKIKAQMDELKDNII